MNILCNVKKNLSENKSIKALGIVFGDIGTSPIYTIAVIFAYLKVTNENVLGVVSLIIWTITLLVTVQYVWFAMGISERNEGGTIILKNIIQKYAKSAREITFITIISYIALSLLIGDSVITPAISILSAVEGISLIPFFQNVTTDTIILISVAITIILFWYQHKGTEKIAKIFSPIMLLWFITIGISGLFSLIYAPEILLKVINPAYALRFVFDSNIPVSRLMTHDIISLFVLSDVILSATGGEALYADMGHIGREPITKAWVFVFIMLVLNYMGQGAFLLMHKTETNTFFQMLYSQSHFFYIPVLVLSIMATIIASQAVISGIFSVVYQLINNRIVPLLRIDYKSSEIQSQIYISFANWFLFLSVLTAIIIFRTSNNLAMAYGLAVSGTMAFTGILINIHFYHKKKFIMLFVSLVTTFADIMFLTSNLLYKTFQGGYFALIIATLPFVTIMIYTEGQKRLHNIYKMTDLNIFLKEYNDRYKNSAKLKGTSLFFASLSDKVSPYIVKTMMDNNIIYEKNILVSIERTAKPYGTDSLFKSDIGVGLSHLTIRAGYSEVVDVEAMLNKYNIDETVIFYGFEEIVSNNVFWKIFALIKKLSPSFVRFYKLPAEKVHGVMVRIKM
ncbi:KUP/HAK/KT family potassium transporter [Candidatus Acidulodesulfobacterium sp. H_13]|uniref:KUP/HAK/KT family potassium transporter n=1 Tax=Candidatus Acidulodesulfobacterium sp. H_13 TaxID=3395470 RepID=UPI003AF50315